MNTKVFSFFIDHITSTGKILCDFFISHGGYQKPEAKEMAEILSNIKKEMESGFYLPANIDASQFTLV